jgi:hypothetical protein
MSDKPLSVDEIMELVVKYGDLRQSGRYADSTFEWDKIRLELVKLTKALQDETWEVTRHDRPGAGPDRGYLGDDAGRPPGRRDPAQSVVQPGADAEVQTQLLFALVKKTLGEPRFENEGAGS